MQQELVGTWRLTAYEAIHPGGRVEYPFGADAVGLLVYTDGFMTGQVMRRNRAHLPPRYRKTSATNDALDAFDGYIAYYGRYRIDESAGEVVHEVEASLYPNWVGGEQRRSFQLDGNRLTLSAVRHVRGETVVNRLVWERVDLVAAEAHS